jgi:carbohydrate kinase (thermoresistant glucokinase family)
MTVLVLMGVSGSGKTALAEALVARLGWRFQEGDALHPPANVEKMRSGRPLDDADRWPWLDRIAAWIDARLAARESGVITCSALKRAYRARIIGGRRDVRLLFLTASPALLAERVARRRHEYMPASLLESQLRTLEPPGADEDPIVLSVDRPIADLVEQVMAALAPTPRPG